MRTVVGPNEAVLARMKVTGFKEILDNYLMRIYFRKRNLFSRCLALTGLHEKKIDFIVNNAKPEHFKIGERLIKQG